MTVRIRPANRADLPRLTEIYNHYVIHTPVTFDVEPYTVERRAAWFEQFASSGRHRLVVAEEDGLVLGYAGTTRFRPKAAYDTTVETTVYSSHDAVGKGIGRKVYAGLFEALAGENINRIVGGYTLPNDGSARLHEFFGFKNVGVFTQVATSSENTGTCNGQSVRCAWLLKPRRTKRRLLKALTTEEH